MIDKLDNSINPVKEQLIEYTGSASALLKKFCDHIESAYQPKEQIDYSRCASIQGWNLKYKVKGKSLCVVYPYKDYFCVMITLAAAELYKFSIVKKDFGTAIQKLVDEAKPFNNTKWIVLKIICEADLSEAYKLAALKCE